MCILYIKKIYIKLKLPLKMNWLIWYEQKNDLFILKQI